jgi:hypothetical protein
MAYTTFSVKNSFRCSCQLYVAKTGQYRKISIGLKITVYHNFQKSVLLEDWIIGALKCYS